MCVCRRQAELLAARASEPESGGEGRKLFGRISSEINQLTASTPVVSSATDFDELCFTLLLNLFFSQEEIRP